MTRGARIATILALAAVAAAAALWMLPARWAIAWIPDSSPVVVTDASGTMWDARATLAIGVGGLRRTLPEPVQWRLVFDGGPQLRVSHPWLQGPLTLSAGLTGARLSAQSLQLPASALTAIHAMFNTLDPGGELHLAWPDLVVGRSVSAAGAAATILTAQWRNASSSLSRIKPMGDYTLTLNEGAGNEMALSLSTRQGPLMLEGAGAVSPSRARFDGKAWVSESADASTRAALQGLLAAIGPSTGPDGSVTMKIR